MGDWFQRIVDVEAPAEEAPQLADAILAWLVEAEIVAAQATDCVLGAGLGHAPGPSHAAAVVEADPDFLTLMTNGVEVKVGRTVHHSMGADSVTCPHCGQVIALVDDDGQPNDTWESLSDAIGAWHGGRSGDHPCPYCGQDVGLNDWSWSPPWGFGHLGITFWNWPQLSPRFLTEVSRRLGHRTVHPYGKM